MTIEPENRDTVSLLEDLENEVQIAGALIEAARVIVQAQEAGKIKKDGFDAPRIAPIRSMRSCSKPSASYPRQPTQWRVSSTTVPSETTTSRRPPMSNNIHFG